MELSPECIRPRCGRAEWEHDLHDQGGADDLRWRIWRALGFPCYEFVPVGAILAPDQAATSRWARRPAPSSVAAAQPSPAPTVPRRGADLARELLRRLPPEEIARRQVAEARRKEAS